jgi:hypothetical protein
MPLSSRIIRVPVRLVDGRWEFLYGGAVKVKDGAVGELHLDHLYFTDKKFLKVLTTKRQVTVLAEGTELRVALTVKPDLDATLWQHLLAREATPHRHTAKISVDTRFLSIYLGGPTVAQQKKVKEKEVAQGGLFLWLEGMEPRAIESGMVDLPAAPGLEPVDSLNYAFSRAVKWVCLSTSEGRMIALVQQMADGPAVDYVEVQRVADKTVEQDEPDDDDSEIDELPF